MNKNINQLIYEAYRGHSYINEEFQALGAGYQGNIRNVNIYSKPFNGPISLEHKGSVVSYNENDNIVEISAITQDTNEKIHVTTIDETETKVSVTRNGNVINQFVGSNMTFNDEDDPTEMNIIRIDTV